jgi:arylformamidase
MAMDEAWCDAQYNNRARIPNFAEVIARWQKGSELARAEMPCVLDLAYGSDPAERLDVFSPAPGSAAGTAPVLIFLHGGYWRALDKSDHSFLAPALVSSGALVVVPNYSLCPAVGIADIALQMTRVVAWVHQHAAEYGGDPDRVAVMGHSAGGHLSAMLLCCDWSRVDASLPACPLLGALSMSGLHDLAPLRHAPFLRDELRLSTADVQRLSPARFPAPERPLLAVVGGGESEEFLRQNRLIEDAWGKAAVPVCESVPGADHLTVLHGLADPAHRVHQLALSLVGLAQR